MKRSGTEVLSDINHEAQKVRERVSGLNQKISESNSEVESLRQREAEAYIKLAEVRYELLDDEDIKQSLYRVEKEASSYVRARQEAREQLDKELLENQKEQSSQEEKRKTLQEKVDDFLAKLTKVEQKALQKIEQKETYQAAIKDIESTENFISRIENKIVVATEDYEEKLKPYHADPLFMYLWNIGYGTSKYRKGNIRRIMDRWVAGVCNYEPARRNYAMLSGIPEKLQIHREQLIEKTGYLQEKVDEIEEQAFAKDGVTTLREEYEKKHQLLETLDAGLTDLETRHHEILQEKEKFSSNTDRFYSGAIQKLQELYKGKNLRNLRRNAAATPTAEDDDIVKDLFFIEDRIEILDDEISQYQSTLRQEEWKLAEVQKVRKEFKEKGYGHRLTTFKDGNMFVTLLGQFMVGVLTNQYFWRAVGDLCEEIFDDFDLDLDDMFESRGRSRRRRRSYGSKSRSRSRSRSRSKDGFRTGGHF